MRFIVDWVSKLFRPARVVGGNSETLLLDIPVLLQQINLRKDFFILLIRQQEYPKEKGGVLQKK